MPPNSRAIPATLLFFNALLKRRDAAPRAEIRKCAGRAARGHYKQLSHKLLANSLPVAAIPAKFLRQIEIFTGATTLWPKSTLIQEIETVLAVYL